MESVIYLDQAATSFPKPPGVAEAVQHWFAGLGVSADRGDGRRCTAVAGIVARVRERIGALCGTPSRRVAFTSGATEGINLFLRSFLRDGDRVLTTTAEHSSVIRPLVALRDTLAVKLTVLPVDACGRIDPADAARSLGERPHRLFAFSHASNVTGAVTDARALCTAARRAGCATLLDASQTAGLLPLDVGADTVVASAHKGLLGPPGLGFVAARPDLRLAPAKQGGTGSSRALDRHPESWPEAFEAGTPNTPAILGLAAALEWIDRRGRDDILGHGLALIDALRAALDQAPHDLRIHGPPAGAQDRIPVLSFTLGDMDPAEVGVVLDEAGIHVRTGYHCAPWIHETLGTTRGGTVRVSPGPFVREVDILEVAAALRP